jgi:cytochrome c oxidase cbb3-type subunit 1
MESYAKNFVGASLVYFLLASVIGLGMVLDPGWSADFLQIHVHFMLLGWMSMMIFGVGYHILPRFQGHANIPRAWARFHFLISNVGLLGMGAAWWAGQGSPSGYWTWILAGGGALNVIGFIIFMVIIFRGLVPAEH